MAQPIRCNKGLGATKLRIATYTKEDSKHEVARPTDKLGIHGPELAAILSATSSTPSLSGMREAVDEARAMARIDTQLPVRISARTTEEGN